MAKRRHQLRRFDHFDATRQEGNFIVKTYLLAAGEAMQDIRFRRPPRLHYGPITVEHWISSGGVTCRVIPDAS